MSMPHGNTERAEIQFRSSKNHVAPPLLGEANRVESVPGEDRPLRDPSAPGP